MDATGLVLGTATQCWWEGGGGYGTSGSYGIGGGYGGAGGGNATCVADCVATTLGMCSGGQLPDGKQRMCDYKKSKNWSGSACEEFCNGGGGGGKPEPEGCKGTPPTYETPGTWECVGREWKFRPMEDRKPPQEDMCKKYPEKCADRKPEPQESGTREEKLAAIEEKIGVLGDQIDSLRADLQSTKDDVAAKNDEIRALKKSGASRAEINAAQKELKSLKREASAIKNKGKKLTRELKFREQEHARLQFQGPPSRPISF